MGWMLERIGQRRDELAEQAGHVRKQLADIEAELADLIAAERVVGRILAEPDATDAAPGPVASGVVPRLGQGQLPGEYARLWRFVVSAAGPVGCKDVCAELGLSEEPKHVEGVRSKLKRLVSRGWLAEPTSGKFTAAAPVVIASTTDESEP
jgi:hypothetical protein